ncbi:MAM33 family protein [Aspergillus saccharolyticus JOP 1030-1]|uniref:Mitochondrial glyco protein n=1 Tax=Aspergillus saccharolyticus JOP 1030-1 TaxID=1450539 RepID=A0A318Z1W7_9EURO|nr:mitochondrial glyco protein [Aspergillus saccharolyticus JOP 1030-1]PYH40267.1 mitochondrial glyco protein [Aspergillus saccharolyticus JOP 1030-1]
MMSLRTITRSAPRSIARSLAVSTRATISRPVAAVSQNAFTLKQITKPAYAAFSTSRAFKQSPAEGDVELVAKLEDELKHEKASGLEDLEGSVQNIQYVLQNNSWEVKDIPGEQEVTLTKKFGKEEIRLTFTVADLQNLSEQEDFSADGLMDANDFGAHQPANQGRAGISQLPEDRIAPSDRDELDIDDLEPSFPARVNITIEKPGSGALLIQTLCSDGVFQVEELSYFNKPDLALAQTAEKDWARQSLYAGPPFENLDEELQNFVDRYLDVRGINAELATMIPDYIQVKEQKEYVRWLESVKNFVAA